MNSSSLTRRIRQIREEFRRLLEDRRKGTVLLVFHSGTLKQMPASKDGESIEPANKLARTTS